MKRKIASFHLDEEDDWVAVLDCGHAQHVRHRPPFVERAWVVDEVALECAPCNRLQAPEGLMPYSATPQFTAANVPAGLLQDHSTKPGVWGRIEVLAGTVTYVTAGPERQKLNLEPGCNAMIPPELQHHVVLSDDARFRVVFLKAGD